MKKLIIAAAFVAISGAAMAQKPAAGDVTAEVQLNFQLGSAPISVQTPTLRGRYFLSDDVALRINLAVTNSSNTTQFAPPASDTSGLEGELEESNSSFTIGAGIEKHFAGTSRLSPYVGAQLFFNSFSESETGTNVGFDLSGNPGFSAGTNYSFDQSGSSRFGVGIFGAADYYFVDHVYLGIEVGWQFSTTSYGDTEFTSSSTGSPATSTTSPGGSASDLSVVTNSGLRLGFVF